MKIDLYLEPEGMERIAKGEELYYWDFSLRLAGDKVPEGKALLAKGLEVQLPGYVAAVHMAIKSLETARAVRQKEALETDREYQVRINNLLALTYSPAGDSL